MKINSRKTIAVFLAVFMVLGCTSIVVALETMRTPHQEQELQFDWEMMGFEELFYIENQEESQEIAISESRRKYLELLQSGYNNHRLRQRFVELFGDGFSGEYIFNNYRTIFDLKEDEVIDSAFLRVLSGYRIDFRFQNTGVQAHSNMEGRMSHDGRVRIFEDSQVADVAGFDEMFLESMSDDIVELVNMYEVNFEYQTTAFVENFSVEYHVNTQEMVNSLNANTHVTIRLVNVTYNSITVDLWFSNNNSLNNAFGMRDPITREWRWIFGQGQPRGGSGRQTITGLFPGLLYNLEAVAHDGQGWQRSTLNVVTPMPSENLVFQSRSSIDFNLDRVFIDALGGSLNNRFLDATNQAFYVMRDFVGEPTSHEYGRMRINHVRDLPWHWEALSGHPIRWQLHNVHNVRYFYSIDAAHRMRVANVETTETPIHEIGHNFDNFRWSFEPEAMAVFFTYYYYVRTGRSMVVPGTARTFRGGEFRTYMRSYAYRALGTVNHQEAMRRGIYTCYSMAYTLAVIAGNIGWQPFTDTFEYFRSLPYNRVPQSDLGKLNLFLTRLRDFSGGRDVIAMIPAQARPIYEQFFGGRIQYVVADSLEIIPDGEWRISSPGIAYRPINVIYGGVWSVSVNAEARSWLYITDIIRTDRGGSFVMNVTENMGDVRDYGVVTVSGRGRNPGRIIEVRQAGRNASLELSPSDIWYPPSGGSTRVIMVNTNWNSWSAVSTTVNTSNDWLNVGRIAGIVEPHFSITARPNNTPNGQVARVIVTAGNQEESIWVSQQASVPRLGTPVANPSHNDILRGTARQYFDMRIGWPLGNGAAPHSMNLGLNRINSRFGTRPAQYGLHLGMDIIDPAGSQFTYGVPIISVVDGVVMHRFMDGSDGRGFGISIRATCDTLRDPVTNHHLIFTYIHMSGQPPAMLTEGVRVSRGQVIGFVGTSGRSFSDGHLHFEVVNGGDPLGPGGPRVDPRENLITRRVNPRFFFDAGAFQGNVRTLYIWCERRDSCRCPVLQ